jgi:dipeptidase E
MSKLFLSSSFAGVAGLFRSVAEESGLAKTVTFIPTASTPEKVKFYVDAGRKALQKLGFMVDELDVSVASPEEIARKLQANEYIYVSGGNTFFLLQELKRTGADRLIVEQVRSGKMYIGESAGSMIVAPDIEYAKALDDCRKAPDLQGYDALDLVDFHPVPHHGNFPFKKAVEKIIAGYEDTLKLYPISNAQALLVEGDIMTKCDAMKARAG